MIHVLEIIRDGTAVVETDGLRRIVIQPGGEVVREMCHWREAETYAKSYNKRRGKTHAEVLTYPEALARSSS